MKRSIKAALGYIPGLLGYEFRRKQPEAAEFVLSRVKLATILDVGANVGQFASAMRTANPEAIIHSFEPIPAVEQTLRAAFRGDERFFAYRTAVSDSEGVAEFDVNTSSASSSLLPLGEIHKKEYPHLTVTRKIEVPITTLDHWAAGVRLDKPILLKLDIQGKELAALRGGSAVLADSDFVLLEINFAAMYKGQPTFDEIYQVLSSAGFSFADFFPSRRDPKSLRCLFGDALFVR